jgi:hypothetical protein
MFGSVKDARCVLEGAALELDAEEMFLPDARGMLDELAMIRRLADGMIGKLARRIE